MNIRRARQLAILVALASFLILIGGVFAWLKMFHESRWDPSKAEHFYGPTMGYTVYNGHLVLGNVSEAQMAKAAAKCEQAGVWHRELIARYLSIPRDVRTDLAPRCSEVPLTIDDIVWVQRMPYQGTAVQLFGGKTHAFVDPDERDLPGFVMDTVALVLNKYETATVKKELEAIVKYAAP